ncbi:toprim domain-containing protein [Alkalicoccus daliensis]|uniref:Toprim domain protein n=1 Tax=Alkalicoccus daliensis TaxID=745820 RepID=A0A1H0EAK1_9BACI|nr:toprim domain-containing protein [Alkalicoccus daliensis]SDN79464.1 toprim domain protein [Alkalicoccus daliensis]
MIEKVIIVEGKNDRARMRQVLDEPVEIICTHGTLSVEKLERFIYPVEDLDVFILVDEDDAGIKLRRQLMHELPNAVHLYIEKEFRQVETTPLHYLQDLLGEYFAVKNY